MRVVGVIAEYNPFHRGHKWHLRQAKKAARADYAVAVMSGCFVQRGEAAVLSPADRARMALMNGADAVILLPALWSLRDAEHFAFGGASLLNSLGCDAISFGAEDAELPRLTAAARLLESPDAAFTAALHRHLDRGLPHPAALSAAAEKAMPGLGALLSSPNNTLAVCYLRAMLRLGSVMEVCPIPRIGSYHATGLDEAMPSATAVRGAMLRGDWASASAALPESARPILMTAAQEKRIHRPEALDMPLLYRLRTAPLTGLPGVTEGVDDRLLAAAAAASDREALLEQAKTRRYPRARLARLCAHALLNITQADLDATPLPPAALLLGFRQEAAPLLKRLSAGDVPLLTRAADFPKDAPWFRIERRAWDLWALGCGLPSDMIFTQKMVRV